MEVCLAISPLLKWYAQHGLKVTKIHQVVEYWRIDIASYEDRSDPESLRMERTEKDYTFT